MTKGSKDPCAAITPPDKPEITVTSPTAAAKRNFLAFTVAFELPPLGRQDAMWKPVCDNSLKKRVAGGVAEVLDAVANQEA